MGHFQWEPDNYRALMRLEVPDYERLQAELVEATRGITARSILELGTGTGETTRRILAAHPQAHVHGIDSSPQMLAAARSALAGHDIRLDVARIEDPLPDGRFDLIVSALTIHHLDGSERPDCSSASQTYSLPVGGSSSPTSWSPTTQTMP